MSPLRLAILEADTPQPQTRDRYGGYTGVFTALLEAAAKPQKLEELVMIKGYDVVNELHSYPSLDDIDAILITGSRHTAFDNDPWILKLVEYTKKAIESNRVRVVGVCFGHQIIGRAEGAQLGRSNKGWEVAVTEVDLTDKGKEIFGLDKMVRHMLRRYCATVSLMYLHSASIKCIEISSTNSQRTPFLWAPMRSAKFKASTHPANTLLCRDTPNSPRRSSQRSYLTVIRLASSRTRCIMML
jgi:GMP synthase-like glutamine amidotransferase